MQPVPARTDAVRRVMLLLLMAWLNVPGVWAQVPRGSVGMLTGTVFDSIARAPLVGAIVSIAGTGFQALTDSGGAFRFEGVTHGPVRVLVTHDHLDAIGISLLTGVAVVVPDSSATLVVSVPSFQSIARRLGCTEEPVGEADRGIVFGSVRDVDSGALLAGAMIALSWIDARVSTRGVQVDRPSRTTVSDRVGQFAICGVPIDAEVAVQAYVAAGASGVVRRVVGPRGLARLDLHLTRSGSVRQDSASGRLRGRAMLAGSVLTRGDGPLAAQVGVEGAQSEAITDANGRFVILDLPAGSGMATARAIGYKAGEAIVELRDGDTTWIVFRLEPLTVLDSVTIRGSRVVASLLEERDRRARAGIGYRLGSEEIRRMPAVRNALQNIPALRVREDRQRDLVLLSTNARGECPVEVYRDGVKSTALEIQVLTPAQVVSIEYFPRASMIPLRFQTLRACAALLVWTVMLEP